MQGLDLDKTLTDIRIYLLDDCSIWIISSPASLFTDTDNQENGANEEDYTANDRGYDNRN